MKHALNMAHYNSGSFRSVADRWERELNKMRTFFREHPQAHLDNTALDEELARVIFSIKIIRGTMLPVNRTPEERRIQQRGSR